MNAREKQIAIWVGVAIGLYGIDQFLLEPYFDDWNKADTLIEHHQSDLRTDNDILRKRLEASKTWKQVSYGKMESDASSASQLVINRVQECARDAGVTISSLATEKADKEQGYERVSIKPIAEGNMNGIGRFLYGIRQSDIPVRIGDIQITTKKEGFDDLQLALTLTTIISPTATPPAKVAVSSYGREGLQ